MRRTQRSMVISIALSAAVTFLGIAASPIAAAGDMNINATGGDGTAVDSDGTQGDLKPAVQGTTDTDGDQDSYLHGSSEAVPQYKAK